MSTSDWRGPLQVERRAALLDELRRHGTMRVGDLVDRLGVTAVTVRKDIERLAADGLVRRVYGGVTLIAPAEPGPEPAAVATDLGGASTIGMLVPSLDYYWPDVARGAEDAAREAGLKVVLRGSSYEVDDDRPQLERLLEGSGADALAVAVRLDAPTTAATLDWLAGCGVPVVLVERSAAAGPDHLELESVVSNHALGATTAVRHLHSLGHTRIGVVLSRMSPTSAHVRRGWLASVTELGLDLDVVDADVPWTRSPQWPAALDETLDRCLATGTTALVVCADTEAIALVQRCEERHISVPGDLSVVSYDDEVAGLFSPPLTAVRPHRGAIGRAAAELLVARLADGDRPVHQVVINPSLRVRASSAPPRG